MNMNNNQFISSNETSAKNLWLTNTSPFIPEQIELTTVDSSMKINQAPSINDAFNSNLTALVESNNPTNPFSPYGYSIAAQAQSPHLNQRQTTIFTPKRGTNPFDDDLIRRWTSVFFCWIHLFFKRPSFSIDQAWLKENFLQFVFPPDFVIIMRCNVVYCLIIRIDFLDQRDSGEREKKVGRPQTINDEFRWKIESNRNDSRHFLFLHLFNNIFVKNKISLLVYSSVCFSECKFNELCAFSQICVSLIRSTVKFLFLLEQNCSVSIVHLRLFFSSCK